MQTFQAYRLISARCQSHVLHLVIEYEGAHNVSILVCAAPSGAASLPDTFSLPSPPSPLPSSLQLIMYAICKAWHGDLRRAPLIKNAPPLPACLALQHFGGHQSSGHLRKWSQPSLACRPLTLSLSRSISLSYCQLRRPFLLFY